MAATVSFMESCWINVSSLSSSQLDTFNIYQSVVWILDPIARENSSLSLSIVVQGSAKERRPLKSKHVCIGRPSQYIEHMSTMNSESTDHGVSRKSRDRRFSLSALETFFFLPAAPFALRLPLLPFPL